MARRSLSLSKGLTELSLIASTSQRNLREDPLPFALLVGRRLAPRLRGRLDASTPGLRGALAAYVSDRPALVAEKLRDIRPTRLSQPLVTRLALAVGADDLVADQVATSPRLASDLAWHTGDLTRAVELLGDANSLLARRRRSELRLLDPGFTLPAEAADPIGPHASSEAGSHRALHVLTNSLPHTRSGYTARTHSLLLASREVDNRVMAVTRIGYPTVIGALGAKPVDTVDGIEYHRIIPTQLPVDAVERLQAQVAAIDELVRSFRPTMLHTTTDFTNALVTEALARRHGLPWVYEMRGQLELTWVASRPERWRERAAASEKVRLLRDREADLARRAGAVVVLSEVQKADLVERGVPAEKIFVAPNAVNPALLERNTAPADARQALGLPREGIWCGTVSSLVDYEGLDVVLRAVALARSRGVDLRCAIVGEGVARPALVALAAELGIEDVVRLPGRVGAAEAVRWHEALDIFTVPRRDTPVCRVVTPMKAVEAMALGRPVVASDLPALAEVVGDGGVLVEAEDVVAWAEALARLAPEPNLRAELGVSGRELAATRTWQHDAVMMKSAYERARLRG